MELPLNKILNGDALEILKTLPDESVDCVITSPPYWSLRDYGMPGQLGVESTFTEYINRLCDIFDEAKRVLKSTGTCWVNLGDTYNSSQSSGTKKFGNEEFNKNRPSREATKTPDKKKQDLPEKTLLQIPSRFAIEMTNRGWILRNEIVWHKPNCMPSSATDRFTVDFEKIFFFTKRGKYYFETQQEKAVSVDDPRMGKGRMIYEDAKYSGKNRPKQYGSHAFVTIAENRNKRTVWKIPTKGFSEAHFAVFPEELCETPIKAGSPRGGVILDPFMGAGTTGVVARKLERNYIGIELNPEYIKIAEKRISTVPRSLFEMSTPVTTSI